MSSKIASSPVALPLGAIFLVSLSYLGYHYSRNLVHPSPWIYFSYLWLSAVGIVSFDLMRRRISTADRKQQARFGRVWRASGLTWHVVGVAVALTTAIWSANARHLVESEDPVRDLYLDLALNYAFIVAVPLALCTVLTQAIQFFRMRSVQKWINNRKRLASLLAFIGFGLPTLLLAMAVPLYSYEMVRSTIDYIPSSMWAALLGAAAAAYLFHRAT
ncbi:hypothetical protein G6L08_22810 [Agrobacterium rhizogenes]|nr:hypothetical protein [Rhizobium rhizogenes]